MQQVNVPANPQLAAIFKQWADNWGKETQGDKKDMATKFHTVYKIAADLFTEGGDTELQFLHSLFEDCKQKIEHADVMSKKIRLALKDDEARAQAMIATVNTTAQEAIHVVRYLGQLLMPAK